MKKYLIRFLKISLLPLITFMCVFFIVYNYVPNCDYDTLKIRGYTIKRNRDLDAVIVGDSGAFNGIIPAELYKQSGLCAYNSGKIASRVTHANMYLNDMYDYQQPSVVIVETTMFNYYWELDENVSIEKYGFFESLYKNHNFIKKQLKVEKYIRDKGYTFVATKNAYTGRFDYLEKNSQIDFNKYITKQYIDKMVDIIRSNNSIPLFVNIPSVTYTNKTQCEATKKYCLDNDIDYIDFNYPNELENYTEQLDLTTDSHDKGVHLNCFGAKKVTDYIAWYLVNKMNVEPKGENDYFENDCEKFFEVYAKYYKE